MNLKEFTYAHPHALYFFDLDETLFKTEAKVDIYDKSTNRVLGRYGSKEWNLMTFDPVSMKADSREFQCAEIFATTSTPIRSTLEAVGNLLATDPYHTTVVILTARWGFHDMPRFDAYLKDHGVENYLFEAVGELDISADLVPISVRKAECVRKYLDTCQYDHVTLIDDSVKNLSEFGLLAGQYPEVRFTAWKVEDEESHLYLDANGFRRPANTNWF